MNKFHNHSAPPDDSLSEMVARLRKASDLINKAVEWSLFVLGFSMALITATQVFFRYVLNHSLFWSEELGRMLLVWISFLGATVAYKRDAHIGIDFLVRKLSDSVRSRIKIITDIGSLFFFLVMMIYGAKFSVFIKLQKTPALGLSKSIPFLVIPLSGVVFFVHGVIFLLEDILKETRK